MFWIDTHCHLDAAEFEADRAQVREHARAQGVKCCILPAVEVRNFNTVRQLAHTHQDVYALGIHPMYAAMACEADVLLLDETLLAQREDPRLVAVGEIGLDGFEPTRSTASAFEIQRHLYRCQLKLAQRHQLPVILHVRRAVDQVLKGLRDMGTAGGIAHAFNGSLQQAYAFLDLGFKLGFGGALTYERALQLRRLAVALPLSAIVLETDAPDIPPHWLYTTAEQRRAGQAQGRNTPAELPRIAQVLADLRGISLEELAVATHANALDALPRLQLKA